MRPARSRFSASEARLFWIAAGVWAAFVIGLRFLTDRGLERSWRPASDEALLWWLEPSAYVQVLTVVGLVSALAVGLVILRVGGPRWWIAGMAAGFALLWTPASYLASGGATVVFSDRIESRGPWDRKAAVALMSQVVSVDVGCGGVRVSRRHSIPSVEYVLWLRDGRWVDLGWGLKRRSREGVRDWLRIVDGIDRRLAARGVARVRIKDADGEDSVRPLCIQALWQALPPDGFRAARRILAVGDEDLYAYGLDPRRVW